MVNLHQMRQTWKTSFWTIASWRTLNTVYNFLCSFRIYPKWSQSSWKSHVELTRILQPCWIWVLAQTSSTACFSNQAGLEVFTNWGSSAKTVTRQAGSVQHLTSLNSCIGGLLLIGIVRYRLLHDGEHIFWYVFVGKGYPWIIWRNGMLANTVPYGGRTHISIKNLCSIYRRRTSEMTGTWLS